MLCADWFTPFLAALLSPASRWCKPWRCKTHDPQSSVWKWESDLFTVSTYDKLSNLRTRPLCLFMVKCFCASLRKFCSLFVWVGYWWHIVGVSEMRTERFGEILATFIFLLHMWKQVSAVEIPPDGESVSTDCLFSLSLSEYSIWGYGMKMTLTVHVNDIIWW